MTAAGGGPGAAPGQPAGEPMGHPAVEPAHFFEPIAEHLGSAYLRYSFTKGTVQEIGFLVD